MKDSLVETATPATTSAAPSILEALDMQRRNFFPFPVLWFSLVALEISVLAYTAALEFMQRQHINGRIFNNYGWGGYMEWNAPQLKPFIDGRADIFVYNGVFDDFRRANTIKTSWISTKLTMFSYSRPNRYPTF